MIKKTLLFFLILANILAGAQQKEFRCNEEWVKKIEKIAPEKAEVKPTVKRKVLIFDRFTGYNHWVTPHTSEVMKVLGEKTGAYQAEVTKDVYCLESENLKKYDAVVLSKS